MDHFTATDRTPYCYLIGWSNLNKWYYGVRTRKHKEPSELFNFNIKNPYLTSSVLVSDFRKENGEPDIIQIRKTFVTAEEARLWESTVLKRMKVSKSEKWLNKIHVSAMPPLCGENNPSKRPEVRAKISAATKGKKRPYVTEIRKGKPNGKAGIKTCPHSNQRKENIRRAMIVYHSSKKLTKSL